MTNSAPAPRPSFERGKFSQAARDVLAVLFFLLLCGVLAAALLFVFVALLFL